MGGGREGKGREGRRKGGKGGKGGKGREGGGSLACEQGLLLPGLGGGLGGVGQ